MKYSPFKLALQSLLLVLSDKDFAKVYKQWANDFLSEQVKTDGLVRTKCVESILRTHQPELMAFCSYMHTEHGIHIDPNIVDDPGKWTRADSVSSCKEGWDVFDTSEGYSEIERLDEMTDPNDELGNIDPVFKSDKEAIAFVTRKAQQGSERHRKALRIHNSQQSRVLSIELVQKALVKAKLGVTLGRRGIRQLPNNRGAVVTFNSVYLYGQDEKRAVAKIRRNLGGTQLGKILVGTSPFQDTRESVSIRIEFGPGTRLLNEKGQPYIPEGSSKANRRITPALSLKSKPTVKPVNTKPTKVEVGSIVGIKDRNGRKHEVLVTATKLMPFGGTDLTMSGLTTDTFKVKRFNPGDISEVVAGKLRTAAYLAHGKDAMV